MHSKWGAPPTSRDRRPLKARTKICITSGGVSPPRGGLEGRVKTVGVLHGGNTPCRGRIPSKSKDTPLQMGRYAPPRGGHRPLRECTPPSVRPQGAYPLQIIQCIFWFFWVEKNSLNSWNWSFGGPSTEINVTCKRWWFRDDSPLPSFHFLILEYLVDF